MSPPLQQMFQTSTIHLKHNSQDSHKSHHRSSFLSFHELAMARHPRSLEATNSNRTLRKLAARPQNSLHYCTCFCSQWLDYWPFLACLLKPFHGRGWFLRSVCPSVPNSGGPCLLRTLVTLTMGAGHSPRKRLALLSSSGPLPASLKSQDSSILRLNKENPPKPSVMAFFLHKVFIKQSP